MRFAAFIVISVALAVVLLRDNKPETLEQVWKEYSYPGESNIYHYYADPEQQFAPIEDLLLMSEKLLITGDDPRLILEGLERASIRLGRDSSRKHLSVRVASAPEYRERIVEALVKTGFTPEYVDL